MRISDWSSDVCSSDLTNSQQGQRFAVRHDLLLTVLAIFLGSRCTMPSRPQSPRLATHTPLIVPNPPVIGSRNGAIRSEERRVGKKCVSTCRSRWWPDY